MTTDTPLSVAEIERLLAEATPGDWWAEIDETCTVRDPQGGAVAFCNCMGHRGRFGGRRPVTEPPGNARLIAAVKTFGRMALATARREEAAPELPEGEVEGLIETLRMTGGRRHAKAAAALARQQAEIAKWREEALSAARDAFDAYGARASERAAREKAEEDNRALESLYRKQCIRGDKLHATADALKRALEWFVKRRRSIENDISSAHSNRGDGASEWMREDDFGFRKELREAFNKADEALTAAQGEGEAGPK